MSVPAALKFTYEDYALLPEDRRFEVIDGEPFLTPAPTPFHQVVSERIGHLLGAFLRRTGAGVMFYAPCDVVLSPHDVVQPDIVVVLADHKSVVGVPEMWLVDPAAKTIEVLVNSRKGFGRWAMFGESDTVRSVILAGLEFAAAPVFRPI